MSIENFSIKQFQWTKDKSSKFTSCSEGVAYLAGVDSPTSLIGKTDFDLIWHNRAESYLKEDKIALLNCKSQNSI